MRNLEKKSIITETWCKSKIVDGVRKLDFKNVSFTQYSVDCLKIIDRQDLIAQLLIIGKINNLDFESQDEFYLGMDLLKSAISWN